jgi:AcrR family transcriptional regulator
MAPRTYTQARRAESAATTRKRILDSALALYREQGVTGPSVHSIAARADVSRGTVLNHFGGADGLLDAVLEEIVAGLEYPDARVQEGAGTEDERIRRFVDAMFRFFVRSEAAWPVFSRDMDHPVLKAREAEFYAVIRHLHAATFDDLAGDRYVAAAARAYVNYGPLHDLQAAGLSLDEAIEVVAESLMALARERRRAIEQHEGGTSE